MAAELNLKEKFWIVAMCGDVPEYNRRRLFEMSEFPISIGPQVLTVGQQLKGYIEQITAERLKGRTPGPRSRAIVRLFKAKMDHNRLT